jgi:TetR/AcrR family transcriptional regulator, transcriptional repressor for nem operon
MMEGMSTKVDARERILDAAYDLVFERGFSATTVDAILEATGASKGAFFHHFPSKAALGKALLDRYATLDAEVLEEHMTRAEAQSSDPARQVVAFIHSIEDAVESGLIDQPGCLFASYIYEQIPAECETDIVVGRAIELWRGRIREKLEQASASTPLAAPVDLDTLADHVWTVFEGAFMLARATGDRLKLRDQLAHLRTYLALQLQVPNEA